MGNRRGWVEERTGRNVAYLKTRKKVLIMTFSIYLTVRLTIQISLLQLVSVGGLVFVLLYTSFSLKEKQYYWNDIKYNGCLCSSKILGKLKNVLGTWSLLVTADNLLLYSYLTSMPPRIQGPTSI